MEALASGIPVKIVAGGSVLPFVLLVTVLLISGNTGGKAVLISGRDVLPADVSGAELVSGPIDVAAPLSVLLFSEDVLSLGVLSIVELPPDGVLLSMTAVDSDGCSEVVLLPAVAPVGPLEPFSVVITIVDSPDKVELMSLAIVDSISSLLLAVEGSADEVPSIVVELNGLEPSIVVLIHGVDGAAPESSRNP